GRATAPIASTIPSKAIWSIRTATWRAASTRRPPSPTSGGSWPGSPPIEAAPAVVAGGAMTLPPPRRHEAPGMSTPFSEALRRQLAAACQAFPRLAEPAGSAGLKRAAVAGGLFPVGGGPHRAAVLVA